jgi:hypothetical protein
MLFLFLSVSLGFAGILRLIRLLTDKKDTTTLFNEIKNYEKGKKSGQNT